MQRSAPEEPEGRLPRKPGQRPPGKRTSCGLGAGGPAARKEAWQRRGDGSTSQLAAEYHAGRLQACHGPRHGTAGSGTSVRGGTVFQAQAAAEDLTKMVRLKQRLPG
jgi:hypothetical protein